MHTITEFAPIGPSFIANLRPCRPALRQLVRDFGAGAEVGTNDPTVLWNLYKAHPHTNIAWLVEQLMDQVRYVPIDIDVTAATWPPFREETETWNRTQGISSWSTPHNPLSNVEDSVRNVWLWYWQKTDALPHVPDALGILVMRDLLTLWTIVWTHMHTLRFVGDPQVRWWGDHDISAWVAMNDAVDVHRDTKPMRPDADWVDEDPDVAPEAWRVYRDALKKWIDTKPEYYDIEYYRVDAITRRRAEETCNG